MRQSGERVCGQLATLSWMTSSHRKNERVLKQRRRGEALARVIEISDREIELAAIE